MEMVIPTKRWGELTFPLSWAQHIHRIMVDVSSSAWHWWWLVPPVQDANIQNQTLVNSRLGTAPGGTALPMRLALFKMWVSANESIPCWKAALFKRMDNLRKGTFAEVGITLFLAGYAALSC